MVVINLYFYLFGQGEVVLNEQGTGYSFCCSETSLLSSLL